MSGDDEQLAERRRAARRGATRWLTGHGDVTPRGWLEEVAAAAEDDNLDRYGEHGEVALLEGEVAALLGKPAAAFVPSGTMAQQATLRAWAERSTTRAVAVHGLSHLIVHELDAMTELHGLRPQRLTSDARVVTADDLEALPGPLAAVTVELPLRDAGYLLPSWEQLTGLAAACQQRGVPLHVDGARIWESQPYYDRPLAEIAALADTVYVSFYKGLAGLAGAAVAGPSDVIAEVRRWQARHGGTLFTMLPYAVAARDGLRRRLPRMSTYHARAVELAAALSAAGEVRCVPDPPHTNAFRVVVPRSSDALDEAALRILEDEKLALLPWWQAADVPGWSWSELTVGDATLDWTVDDAVAAVQGLVGGARQSASASASASASVT